MDFCGKSSGFEDFENIVDRESVVKFGSDSGLSLAILRFGSWFLNIIGS